MKENTNTKRFLHFECREYGAGIELPSYMFDNGITFYLDEEQDLDKLIKLFRDFKKLAFKDKVLS